MQSTAKREKPVAAHWLYPSPVTRVIVLRSERQRKGWHRPKKAKDREQVYRFSSPWIAHKLHNLRDLKQKERGETLLWEVSSCMSMRTPYTYGFLSSLQHKDRKSRNIRKNSTYQVYQVSTEISFPCSFPCQQLNYLKTPQDQGSHTDHKDPAGSGLTKDQGLRVDFRSFVRSFPYLPVGISSAMKDASSALLLNIFLQLSQMANRLLN